MDERNCHFHISFSVFFAHTHSHICTHTYDDKNYIIEGKWEVINLFFTKQTRIGKRLAKVIGNRAPTNCEIFICFPFSFFFSLFSRLWEFFFLSFTFEYLECLLRWFVVAYIDEEKCLKEKRKKKNNFSFVLYAFRRTWNCERDPHWKWKFF